MKVIPITPESTQEIIGLLNKSLLEGEWKHRGDEVIRNGQSNVFFFGLISDIKVEKYTINLIASYSHGERDVNTKPFSPGIPAQHHIPIMHPDIPEFEMSVLVYSETYILILHRVMGASSLIGRHGFADRASIPGEFEFNYFQLKS